MPVARLNSGWLPDADGAPPSAFTSWINHLWFDLVAELIESERAQLLVDEASLEQLRSQLTNLLAANANRRRALNEPPALDETVKCEFDRTRLELSKLREQLLERRSAVDGLLHDLAESEARLARALLPPATPATPA